MKKIILILISSIVLNNLLFGQIKNIDIHLFEEPKESLNSFGSSVVRNHFSGIDTIVKYYNQDTIIVFLYFENGVEKKVEGFFIDGSLYRRSFFKNRIKHGRDLMYYKNGQVKRDALYEQGTILYLLNYFSDGKLSGITTTNYSTNREISICFYANGEIENKAIYLDSISFEETDYYDNGQVWTYAVRNKGRQTETSYHRNGEKKFEGDFINLSLSKVGKWQEWYENGTLKSEVYYDDSIPNLPVGTWSYWNEKGKLIKQEKYNDGELEDVKEFLPYSGGAGR